MLGPPRRPPRGARIVTTLARPISIPAIRAAVKGRVIAPDDVEYDTARTPMYGGFDRRPAVIVKVADGDDVAHLVALAQESGLELAVRSGGHSGSGHCVTEGGIVIDLSEMKAIEFDVEGRTAWAESGLTASELSVALAEHGLAVGFGDTGSVGIGGITLGGGIGFLARKYGMTIDNLLAAEVVTADGERLHVDAGSHPDLFWAIRGGGGNFGVATRFQYRLQEVPGIVGGLLVLPATAETIAGFIAAAEAAPEALTTIANVMNCPPMPFVHEEHHGEVVILALMAYAGDPDDAAEAERVLAPFRALATPLADLLGPIPYPAIFGEDDPDYHPTAASRTMFVDRIDHATAEMLVERLRASDASLRVTQLRVLGGAMARVPVDATAFAHRTSRILVNVAAFYDGPDDQVVRERWVTDFVADLHQGDEGAYVGFVLDEGEERIRATYPGATWDRLAEVKARYDPTNLFHLNQNIPPAGPS
jgi:FAD/FMN-containing dehydrogenase